MTESNNNGNNTIDQARLDVLRQLSGSLAHDMRTPLTVIRNALSILRRSQPQTNDSIESLDMIDAEVMELNSILTTLTEITHASEPDLAEIDLESLLSTVVERMNCNSSISWRLDLRHRPAIVWCDSNQLQQIIYNLCRNALTAMKGRGEICISAWQEADNCIIEVRDKGPGIPAEVRSNLFAPFVSTKRNGMGLGLTYCYEILKRHGGSIRLIDSSPSGAAFQISLPQRKVASLKS